MMSMEKNVSATDCSENSVPDSEGHVARNGDF